ncbi:heavy-metal-associated domain-containing protein [Methylosinus sp. Ce-a6]|uniref:heavy-metal-associated domain-containing protein n=1 Tax=Methylosinus sp. Ce-a6 TaxID=2172005 RepID=UPI00135BD7D1|nr:heavy metal-associated domain-containing protein [Methylosinus sp. Ce-a6]
MSPHRRELCHGGPSPRQKVAASPRLGRTFARPRSARYDFKRRAADGRRERRLSRARIGFRARGARGMHCHGCEHAIETALRKLDGVASVRADRICAMAAGTGSALQSGAVTHPRYFGSSRSNSGK